MPTGSRSRWVALWAAFALPAPVIAQGLDAPDQVASPVATAPNTWTAAAEGVASADGTRAIGLRSASRSHLIRLRAQPSDEVAFIPLEEANEGALSPTSDGTVIGAVRVSDANASRLILIGDIRGRLIELSAVGPFASSEESRPSVVAIRREARVVDVGVRLERRDACGIHVAIVDIHRMDLARGTAAAVRAMYPLQSRETLTGEADGTPLAPEHLSADIALTPRGVLREGIDAIVDQDSATSYPASPSAGAVGVPSRISMRWRLAPLRASGLVIDAVPGRHGANVRVRTAAGVIALALPAQGGPSRVVFAEPQDLRCFDVEMDEDPSSAIAIRSLAVIPEVVGA